MSTKYTLKEMPETVEIPLSKGRVALVDASDLPIIAGNRWHFNPKSGAERKEGKKVILMHRLLLNTPPGMVVDHINHDRTDNRRCNIRACTPSQNSHNIRYFSGRSPFKGVTWNAAHNRWVVRIRKNYKRYHVGEFKDQEDAAIYYNVASQLFHGEFACLNPV